MSNAGQALSGVVGAVIGFFVGGPTGAYYGFQVGYLAGTALFPTQLPHLQGPRLGEGQQTVSTVGQPIPWVFGTQTVGGNIIWASPIREVATTEDVGGKGGPEQSQTTYSYYRSFAILLCEGPIAGVRRIWANGKLIYDRSPVTEELEVPLFFGAPAKVVISDALASKMTVYLGTEDQMPDPVIESFEGVGNVPAYRGYAYVVFDDVELKPEDGNRIPATWKFEVYEAGEDAEEEIVLYSNSVLYDWLPNSSALISPLSDRNTHRYRFDGDGSNTFYETAQWRDTLSLALGDAYQAFEIDAKNPSPIGWSIRSSSDLGSADLRPWNPEGTNIPNNRLACFLHYQEEIPGADFLGFKFRLEQPNVVGDEDCAACWMQGVDLESGCLWWSETYTTPGLDSLEKGFPIGFYRISDNASPARWPREKTNNNCVTFTAGSLVFNPDIFIRVERVPTAPPDPEDVGVPTGAPGWYVVDGQLLPAGAWEEVSGTFRVLQAYSSTGTPGTVRYPLNPCLPFGHDLYSDEAFWTQAYELEVARGRMPAGLVYGTDYPSQVSTAYRKTIDASIAETQPVSLASIVSRICERAGLHEYDVSDLADKFVIGYQVARPMAARAAIEPLRSVGFFDVVESGIQLKFPARGKDPVITLTDDDLGAHFVGEAMPSKATTARKLELELPRQVRVHFQNPERDYDPGEELSPARFDTAAESVLDVDLSVAITPTQAAQIAEILMRDFWAARSAHTIQVDQSQSAIEPADAILLPVEGTQHRVRIPSLTERLPNLRVLEAVRDDDGAYVSYAVGTTSQRPTQALAFYGPVELLLLDLPALVTSHNDAGIYAASYPLINDGSFRGVIVSRASQGGIYSTVGTIQSPSIVGRILADVEPGPTTIFDEGTEIIVELHSGELESHSADDVIEGANAAAIGAPGRWEIIQFKNADNTSGGVWTLSGLLRGRKGTEHAVGQTIVNDWFVLLPGVARIDVPSSSIGNEQLYRASPIGGFTQEAEPFTAEGIALKPYSPVQVKGVYDVSGDLVITWDRRDRLFVDEADVPMSESSEFYEVDILDGDTVVRTIQATSPTATYTAAQQAEDFGSSSSSGIDVRVYQISQVVGRGYAAEASL